MVSDVAGDHDSKGQERIDGDFGAPHCSRFFSYSYSASRCSCSTRSSIAIRLIGPQVTANHLDQRSAIAAVQTAIEYEYRFTEYE